MNYAICARGFFKSNVPAEKVEETLRNVIAPDFHLATSLDLPLKAHVVRDEGSGANETVRIVSGQREVLLVRNQDVCVSYHPDGAELPVDSINIAFRGYRDIYTDRGIAWVFPGDKAEMHLWIYRRAVEVPELVTQIIAEAEKVVKVKLLSHFKK